MKRALQFALALNLTNIACYREHSETVDSDSESKSEAEAKVQTELQGTIAGQQFIVGPGLYKVDEAHRTIVFLPRKGLTSTTFCATPFGSSQKKSRFDLPDSYLIWFVHAEDSVEIKFPTDDNRYLEFHAAEPQNDRGVHLVSGILRLEAEAFKNSGKLKGVLSAKKDITDQFSGAWEALPCPSM